MTNDNDREALLRVIQSADPTDYDSITSAVVDAILAAGFTRPRETTPHVVENLGRAEAERRGYPLPDGEADDQSGWTFVEGVHYGFALRAAR